MSLAYRDFWPRSQPSPKAAGRVEWEALTSVVERVNQWLAAAGLRAITIETLLLPASRHAPPNPSAGGLAERWDEDHAWVQVVRVWHEIPPVEATPAVAAVSAPAPTQPAGATVTSPDAPVS